SVAIAALPQTARGSGENQEDDERDPAEHHDARSTQSRGVSQIGPSKGARTAESAHRSRRFWNAQTRRPVPLQSVCAIDVGYVLGVPRISNLLYRPIAFGRAHDRSETEELFTAGGLQFRDAAGSKPALRRFVSRTFRSSTARSFRQKTLSDF